MGSGKGPFPEAGVASEPAGGRGLVREQRTLFPPRGEACGKARAWRDGTGTRIISRSASRCPEGVECCRGCVSRKGRVASPPGELPRCQRLQAAGVTDVCRERARRNGAAASGSLK